ncbi:hypothetical protein [Lewinella sp. IMCC34183]|uniref:hypothetical protein n=1 Tax=Lewinella sp. IMCC34183 TaxID=2248762 RepID=UPI0013003E40|nr:hypothetical protein [Lewinella sp. IMCC34183]
MRILTGVILLAVSLLPSCVSFRAYPTAGVDENPKASVPTAYVSNRGAYRREYRILRHSGAYALVEDSLRADRTIELLELRTPYTLCITPHVTVSLLTLGFYPVKFPERYLFEYRTFVGNDTTVVSRGVEVIKTVSWFHRLSPRKSKAQAIGKSLRIGDAY